MGEARIHNQEAAETIPISQLTTSETSNTTSKAQEHLTKTTTTTGEENGEINANPKYHHSLASKVQATRQAQISARTNNGREVKSNRKRRGRK